MRPSNADPIAFVLRFEGLCFHAGPCACEPAIAPCTHLATNSVVMWGTKSWFAPSPAASPWERSSVERPHSPSLDDFFLVRHAAEAACTFSLTFFLRLRSRSMARTPTVKPR